MKRIADFQRSRTGSDSCRLDTFAEEAEENDVHYSRLSTTILRKNCGHATLASAAVVMDRLEPGRNRVTFHSRSDPLTAKAREREVCDGFPCPALTPDLKPAELGEALGAVPPEVLANEFTYMALLESEQLVPEVAPNTAVLARIG